MTGNATKENKARWERSYAEHKAFNDFESHYRDIVSQRDDLLAALKALQSEICRHGWDDYHDEPITRLYGISLETVRKARAAIAKAEGKTDD